MRVKILKKVSNLIFFECESGNAWVSTKENFEINQFYDVEIEINKFFEFNKSIFVENNGSVEKISANENEIILVGKLIDISDVLTINFCNSILLIELNNTSNINLSKNIFIKLIFSVKDFFVYKTNI